MAPPPKTYRVGIAKVTQYLLNTAHSVGAAKARFFISHGFDPVRPDELLAALVAHPVGSVLVKSEQMSAYTKLVYEGTLVGPKWPIANIRSVWKIAAADTDAEFITAYRF